MCAVRSVKWELPVFSSSSEKEETNCQLKNVFAASRRIPDIYSWVSNIPPVSRRTIKLFIKYTLLVVISY